MSLKGLFLGFSALCNFLPNTFLKNFNSQKQTSFFLMFPMQKKNFSSFGENPFGIFRRCVINEKFHNRLSFSLNIIEP